MPMEQGQRHVFGGKGSWLLLASAHPNLHKLLSKHLVKCDDSQCF